MPREIVDRMGIKFVSYPEEREKEKARELRELKELLKQSPERWAISGDTMAKYGELMLKSTAQVLELLKLSQKENESKDELTEEDYRKITEEIAKNKK
jgi:predicted secreted protein